MFRRLLFFALLTGLCASTARAQLNPQTENLVSEGSIYSSLGVGVPVDYGSSAANGLGLWGVSFIEPYVPTVANPAQWGHTVYGMGTGDVSITNYAAEDNFGDARSTNLAVNNFQLQLPIIKNKLGVSVAFTPYTRTNYGMEERGTRTIGNGAGQETVNFLTENDGSGGINQYELGLGWRINSTISVGYAASIVSASIDNDYYTLLAPDNENSNASYQPVNFTLQTSGYAMGNRAGLYLKFPSTFKSDDLLSLGVSVNFPVDINAKQSQERIFGDIDDDDESNLEDTDLTVDEGTISLPLGLTAGLTYQPSSRFSVVMEGNYQQWSDYRNDLQPAQSGMFTDRMKVGTGIRYFPFVSGSDKFLSNFKYRLGASYDTGHLEIDGQNINTVMFSAGLGLLSPNSNSTIDLSFEYGFRGTTDQNLVKEDIWGFKLSLNLAELFFFRPKLR